MEILSNFASIYCYITFVIGAVLMFVALAIVAMGKSKEPRNKEKEQMNKVHFYIARDKNGKLWLYMGKPIRGTNKFYRDFHKGDSTFCCNNLEIYGLNKTDYANLKWEDEPVEVFINMED